MISNEEKYEYLLRKWGCIEITRGVESTPVFNLTGLLENTPINSFWCSNCSLKKGPFFGIPKTFHGFSAQEAIDLAYKSERVGEQLDLFKEINNGE